MADSIEDMLTGIETLLDVNASQLMEIQELGIASKFTNYINSFQALFKDDTSVATKTNDATSLAKSSLDLWTEIYDWFSDQSEYSSETIFSDENQAKIKGLGIVSSVLGLTSSVIAASDKLDEKQWYDIVADYIDSGKDIFSIVESCYKYNGSSVAELSAGGLYSPLGLYGAIAKAGVASVSQLVRSVGDYSADVEWNLEDTASTGIDFATAGLYEITHFLTLGLDEVIYSAIFKAAGIKGEVNYAEEIANGFKNVGTTIGNAIGNFIVNKIIKKVPQDSITFDAYGDIFLITGSDQADRLYSTNDGDILNGVAGNDTLIAIGSSINVVGGADNDRIWIEGNNAIASGNVGNDVIYVAGNNNEVNGGDGEDAVIISGSNVTVVGGINFDGLPVSDIFSVEYNSKNVFITDFEPSADKVSIGGGDIVVDTGTYEGETSLIIMNSASYETIAVLQDVSESEFENITFTNKNGEVITTSINWLLANKKLPTPINPYDQIKTDSNTNSSNVISGDNINNYEDSVVINAYGETTKVDNRGKNVEINGSENRDSINNYGDSVTINGNGGNDAIYNSYHNRTIFGGEEGIQKENFGNNTCINGAYGNDSIYNGGENVTIHAGEGDDFISNSSYAIYDGDYLVEMKIAHKIIDDPGIMDVKGGKNALIYGDAGNDSILNHIVYATIDGGAGNDAIHNACSNVTIEGGTGDDSIVNFDSHVMIDGGDGNDHIFISSGGTFTISGSTGDDTINTYYGDDVTIIYTSGDGNDSIQGFDTHDTLIIANGTYATTKNDNDIIVTVGNGKITLTAAANLSDVHIEGVFVDNDTTSFNPPLEKKDSDTYEYTGGDKVISDYSSGDKIKYSTDFTGLDVSSGDFFIKSSSGSLKLENVRNELIDVTDNNENTIAYAYLANYEGVVDGSSFNTFEVISASEELPNHLIAGNGGSSLISGSSNDTLQGGAGQDNFIYNKGNDVIANYQSGEIINFAATSTSWGTEGNNFILNAVEGFLRISDVSNKLVEIAGGDGNLVAHVFMASDHEGIIDGRGFGAFEVIVGSDNVSNQILADTAGSSLWGGRGNSNDDLYGNTGSDEYIYSYGNGNDNLFQAGSEDTVNLLNISLEQIASAIITDNGVIARFTDGGSLTISGQAGSFKLGGQTFHADYQNKIWS